MAHTLDLIYFLYNKYLLTAYLYVPGTVLALRGQYWKDKWDSYSCDLQTSQEKPTLNEKNRKIADSSKCHAQNETGQRAREWLVVIDWVI